MVTFSPSQPLEGTSWECPIIFSDIWLHYGPWWQARLSTLIVVQDPASLQPRKEEVTSNQDLWIWQLISRSISRVSKVYFDHITGLGCVIYFVNQLPRSMIIMISYPTRWSLLFIIGSVWICTDHLIFHHPSKASAAMYYCLSVCVRREIGGLT